MFSVVGACELAPRGPLAQMLVFDVLAYRF